MSLERFSQSTMNRRRPGGREPASWAWFIEEQNAGAGGKSELLVGSVPMGVGAEIDSESRNRRPDEGHDQLTGQNLLIFAGPKKRH